MRALTTSLLLAALLGSCGGDAAQPVDQVRAEPWGQDLLEVAGTIPVQEGGRVMPLQTYAGFLMLAANGKRSLKLESGEKLSEVGFLLDLMFFPEQAKTYECFVVSNSDVLDLIKIGSKKRRARYSYEELLPGRELLMDLATESGRRESKSLLDKQLMGLARKVADFESAMSLTDLARAQLELPEGLDGQVLGGPAPRGVSFLYKYWGELLVAMQDSSERGPFLTSIDDLANGAGRAPAIFPPETTVAQEEQWRNPVGALYEGLTDPDVTMQATVGWMVSLERLVETRDDRAAFTAELTRLRDGLEAEASRRGEYGKIASEVRLFNMKLVTKALASFLLGFVLAAASWLLPRSRWFARSSLGASVTGTLLIVVVVTWRSVLRGRPPVLNLYDTILFITGVGTICCLVMEAINRKRVGLSLTPILGALGMFLAFRYEVKDAGISGDTMGQLQAVLDTNFWLATHVTTITAGYAAGLVATLISVVWILLRMTGVWRSRPGVFREMTKMAYGALCFGLLLSVVGTILGGVWANESWGRFWGWDPKENGALLICLSQIMILHARLGGYIRQHGLHVLACLQGAVICFSWWHVNELDAGLHSYGQTEGVLFYLRLTYGFLGLIGLLGVVSALLERGGDARGPGGPKLGADSA